MPTLALLLSLLMMNMQVADVKTHDMDVALVPAEQSISVVDTITVDSNGCDRLFVILNNTFEVSGITSGGKPLAFEWLSADMIAGFLKDAFDYSYPPEDNMGVLSISLENFDGTVTISYSGVLKDDPSSSQFNRMGIADETDGIISEEGTFVAYSSMWFAHQPDKLVVYRMKITTPEGYEVMSEGDIISHEVVDGKTVTVFASDKPFDGVHIIGARFNIETVKQGDVDIMTYFRPGSESLSKTYLDACQKYVTMYEEMIGPYPFSKFAVVENFFQTGYGMPSYTVLGSQVIRLPFIVGISLGHEVLHNWWGNSVYVDYASGNWCEGLTVYGADYHYLELENAADAAEYRRNTNRDYTNYVNEGNDFPLRKFTSRHNAASRSVGYGKTMMVYHQIRRFLGDELFAQAIKNFYAANIWKNASWSDVIDAFEKTGGKDLGWIVEQYVDRAGAPYLALGDTKVVQAGGGTWKLSFELGQAAPVYSLQVPVHVTTEKGTEIHTVALDTETSTFALEFAARPVAISVDPDSELFRRMHPDEIPPVLSRVYGGPNQLIVLPETGVAELDAAYAAMAEALNRTREAGVKPASEVTEEDIATSTLILLGCPAGNPVVAKLLDSIPVNFSDTGFTLLDQSYEGAGNAVVACFKNPAAPDLSAVVIMGTDPMTVNGIGRRLLHYGKYSYLAFAGGQNVAKGIWQVKDSPLIRELQ